MTTRQDRLQGLRVVSSCSSSWESMQGNERRRHCLECDKPVYDFAQLTPREISDLIEAYQGNLCARLTRDGRGQLVTRQPPAVAEPYAPRCVSPLVTAAVMAVLGLSSPAWADPATAVSPAAEQGAGKQPGGTRAQRPGNAGSTVTGRLASEDGEPIPNAEIKLHNQLDGQERIGRTDAEGRFSFASVTAGIYWLAASVGERPVAVQGDVLLAAGEQRQIDLAVPSGVWQSIVAGEQPQGSSVQGATLVGLPSPMHSLYDESSLVVLAVARKSFIVLHEEYTTKVRTELVISSMFKGDTRERVISFYHQQRFNEDPRRLQPGDKVLAFLNPREAEDGRRLEGYVAAAGQGRFEDLKKLPDAELEAYGQRMEALAEVPEHGAARPAKLLEWLVATTEDPITRKEAVRELASAVRLLENQASERKIPVDRYAQSLQDVFFDFVSGGGTPQGWVNPVILATFLTDAHRERLTRALLSTQHATGADLALYDLVSSWQQEDRLLSWLIDQLKTSKLERWDGRRMMTILAKALGDEGLADLLAVGEKKINDLDEQLYSTDDSAAQERLGKQIDTAEEELRRHFVAALGRRR